MDLCQHPSILFFAIGKWSFFLVAGLIVICLIGIYIEHVYKTFKKKNEDECFQVIVQLIIILIAGSFMVGMILDGIGK